MPTLLNSGNYLLMAPGICFISLVLESKKCQATAWVEFITSCFINNFTGGLLEVSAATVHWQTVSDRHWRDSVYFASGEGEKQGDRNQPIFNIIEMKPES